ncbi:hypothetical protein [Arthrobacter cryoconiti]|uniref:Uncharacterized protein n=1 Tax=Arthrobacter cryoconiti TaxID=748907 RepID=A0ABV8QZD6_9MICC|nr:hypothetical protein [Arthrobacter cryoconiti]MCC9069277.1 hypothetical protein [Arthrobacter cryoconiti]
MTHSVGMQVAITATLTVFVLAGSLFFLTISAFDFPSVIGGGLSAFGAVLLVSMRRFIGARRTSASRSAQYKSTK